MARHRSGYKSLTESMLTNFHDVNIWHQNVTELCRWGFTGNTTVLVREIAWFRTGDKQFTELMMPLLTWTYTSLGLNQYMMTSSNGNIFRVTGPLCGEFTGPDEFPAQRPVTRSFHVFFDLGPNKRLRKQPWGWWFETPSWSLWRQCNETRRLMTKYDVSALERYRSNNCQLHRDMPLLLSGVPDYFGRNKIPSGGDLSHYSSASLY